MVVANGPSPGNAIPDGSKQNPSEGLGLLDTIDEEEEEETVEGEEIKGVYEEDEEEEMKNQKCVDRTIVRRK